MPKKRTMTARERIIRGIHFGETNAEIVAAVRADHPRSPTTAATVNYIRNEVRKGDKSVKSDRAVRKARH
jgi:hypothetical protein